MVVMKIKTSELIGPALDWAVAKAGDYPVVLTKEQYYAAPASSVQLLSYYQPSTEWAQGGPIIERGKIELTPPTDEEYPDWMAVRYHCNDAKADIQEGPTPLIAAMRCFVASKLGDEIEVPEELIQA